MCSPTTPAGGTCRVCHIADNLQCYGIQKEHDSNVMLYEPGSKRFTSGTSSSRSGGCWWNELPSISETN